MDGTIIIESTGNLERLEQPLETLISRTFSPGPSIQIRVVCKEKVHPRVKPFLQRHYRSVPLLVLPGENAGSYLLNKVRSEKVAFMPEDSAFCFPGWEAIDRVPGSIIPLVGHVEYPVQTAWIKQQNADGWLCRTRTAVKHLAASNSLEEWTFAEIFNE